MQQKYTPKQHLHVALLCYKCEKNRTLLAHFSDFIRFISFITGSANGKQWMRRKETKLWKWRADRRSEYERYRMDEKKEGRVGVREREREKSATIFHLMKNHSIQLK